jgi:predicted ATPase
MQLKSYRVRHYRNFVDSGDIDVSDGVTCLVGKNESGKTALLQALCNLNPAGSSSPKFDLTDDYPRWLKKEHEISKVIGKESPIRAIFVLDEHDMTEIAEQFGEGVVTSTEVSVAKTYANELQIGVQLDEEAFVAGFIGGLAVDQVQIAVRSSSSIKAVLEDLDGVAQRYTTPRAPIEPNPALVQRVEQVRADLQALAPKGDLGAAVRGFVRDRLPRFFYFGEYELLPGRVEKAPLMKALEDEDDTSLPEEQRTALALLRLANTSSDNLGDSFEVTISELEAVANLLTKRVREYWHQNKHLRMEIAVEPEYAQNPNDPSKQILAREWIQFRVNDTRHDYTNNLDRRSTGFRWFASFFAAFFEFEGDDNVIVLLDEPGLHLHGSAQKDLLRFIDERLTPTRQVLHSTHSPWMVPNDLARVRIVEDAEDVALSGTIVTDQAATRDPDTLFPLQAALGYDVAQNLFIGEDNLAVEGVSDFIYLTLLSDHLASLGRASLDPVWRILPCGSADNIPAFVNLIGPHLKVSVLLDSGQRPNQRIDNLANAGVLDKRRIVTMGGVLGRKEADIEDVFEDAEYLELFNRTFPKTKLKISDLKGTDRIVARIERKLGEQFNHGLVAQVLLKQSAIASFSFSEATLNRAEELVKAINSTR